MTKKLILELSRMEDWEFNLLEHHLHIARMVRDIMSKYAIDEKEMAKILHVLPKKMKSLVNGAYPFDFRLLSRLDAYNQLLASNNTKMKVEAESIGFENYKNQYPVFLERITKLLNILEPKP